MDIYTMRKGPARGNEERTDVVMVASLHSRFSSKTQDSFKLEYPKTELFITPTIATGTLQNVLQSISPIMMRITRNNNSTHVRNTVFHIIYHK